jgi:5,6-dimethylbenzimidazole synthase
MGIRGATFFGAPSAMVRFLFVRPGWRGYDGSPTELKSTRRRLMELYEAVKGRRSCRSFSAHPVDDAALGRILDAANWAPSPMNAQPWEFIVVTDPATKERIRDEAERCRVWAREQSGWAWLDKYRTDFLKTAPVLVVVVGNPGKTGVDRFQAGRGTAYQHACAAAVQNMLLAAHAEGLGSLWFTLYDKINLSALLGIAPERSPLAVVCLGVPDEEPRPVSRKDVKEKTRVME